MTRWILPIFLVLGSLTTAFCSSGSSRARSPAELDASWATGAPWDDGKAEIALYEAKRPQYGKIESYEAVLLVVKEDFDLGEHVKADPPYEGKKLQPVLKLNAVHSYWTDNYPYNYMLSLFVRRDAPTDLVKATLTGQEWCGNTFKQITTRDGKPELIYSSYFAGDGDGRRDLPGDLLEDQLLLALRGLRFTEGRTIQRRVLPSLISNKVGDDRPVDTTITVRARQTVSTPAGDIEAWHVEVRGKGLDQELWFDAAAPHTLVKMTAADGRALLLKERMRKAYWDEATVRPSR